MPNSPEQGQAYNDEIDLADLIRALWQGKWLVIGVTLVVLSFGIVYLKTTPKAYTGSLGISKLPSAQADVYDELNELNFMLNSGCSVIVDIGTDTKAHIISNCYLLRPIVINHKLGFIDAYHG